MTRPAPFAHEVWSQTARGRWPAVTIFVGRSAFDAAERHRIEHGPGTAIALTHSADPAAYSWPSMVEPVIQDAGTNPASLLKTAAAVRAAGAERITIRPEHGPTLVMGSDRAA